MFGDQVTLKWQPAADNVTQSGNATPSDALSYNIRIGTASNGCEIVSAAPNYDNSSGYFVNNSIPLKELL